MTRRFPFGALLGLLLASPAASPATFEVRASGPFEVVDPMGLFPFMVPPPGTVLNLTFSFSDDAPPFATEPSRARYMDGISPLRIEIGGETYSLPGGTAEIVVTNDCACSAPSSMGQAYEDSWQVNQVFFRPEEGLAEFISLSLAEVSWGVPGGPLSSTALTAPPALAEGRLATIFYVIREDDPARLLGGRLALLRGQAMSLEVTPVPGPAAVWLLGTALAAIGAFARSATAKRDVAGAARASR